MPVVDMRSDTITHPTDAMRSAMATAEVGDDVLGDDPTVRRLEEMAADKMGKQAGLFVASGTMGNLVSQLTHCGRGDEVILGHRSHVFLYEQGGAAALGGIHPHTIANLPDGKLDIEEIRGAVRADNPHFPRSRLIILENTHNACSGMPLAADYIGKVAALAAENNLKLHIDGARIFNAAVALGVPPATLVAAADSVTFCLSKALAAPVGSVVCGSKSFIAKARRNRKVLGGGMRQAGILAAAGIVALTEMVDRLAEDHANAKRLALGLADIQGLKVDPIRVVTDIVFIEVTQKDLDARTLAEALDRRGVRLLAADNRIMRAVTNYHVTAKMIDHAIEVFRRVMG
jgi:threonine aldolase